MLVDTADRGRRHIEGEVGEAREHMSQLTNANNALSVDRRRLEADLRGAQQELDNLVNQVSVFYLVLSHPSSFSRQNTNRICSDVQ